MTCAGPVHPTCADKPMNKVTIPCHRVSIKSRWASQSNNMLARVLRTTNTFTQHETVSSNECAIHLLGHATPWNLALDHSKLYRVVDLVLCVCLFRYCLLQTGKLPHCVEINLPPMQVNGHRGPIPFVTMGPS